MNLKGIRKSNTGKPELRDFKPFAEKYLGPGVHYEAHTTGAAHAFQQKKEQGMNKIIIIGNVGQTPELRKTPKGNTVLTLSVATNRDVKKANGESVTETHWHRATVWGLQAERCAREVQKGSRVFVEGELLMRVYKDKEGVSRKSAEINVDLCRLMAQPRPEAIAAGEVFENAPEAALMH